MIKIKPDSPRPAVTENLRKAVTNIHSVTKTRGRPKKADALSVAERKRRQRAKARGER